MSKRELKNIAPSFCSDESPGHQPENWWPIALTKEAKMNGKSQSIIILNVFIVIAVLMFAHVSHAQNGATSGSSSKAEIEAEFKADRAHIIKFLRDLMDQKGYIGAVAWGERFAEIEDAEFQELYSEARRLNGMQQTEMKKKMDAKQARLNKLKEIDTSVEGTHAIRYCQNLVKAELKVPREAKFPWDTEVQVTGTNERFIVNSYVEAPNSFNAKVRTPYFCRLSYNGGGASGWTVEELRLGED